MWGNIGGGLSPLSAAYERRLCQSPSIIDLFFSDINNFEEIERSRFYYRAA